MIVSAGYIKPVEVVARGDIFVFNDKKVKGFYYINNKYRFMWNRTPVYFYAVKESNPIDPIRIDKINQYMKTNSIVSLRQKDVDQGIRLRILTLNRSKKEALELLEQEEGKKKDSLDASVKDGIERIESTTKALAEKYDKQVDLGPMKKSYILIQHLLEQDQISQTQYDTFLQKIEHGMSFENLIKEVREIHEVGIVTELDEETERFIHDISHQQAEEWAGFTQDMRSSKRGLREMLARPVRSTLSTYLMVPATAMANVIPGLEVHYNDVINGSSPIGIFINKRNLIVRKIDTRSNYFVLNDKQVKGVFTTDSDCQYMWNKTPCYIYNISNQVKEDNKIIKELKKYFGKRMVNVKKHKGKVTQKANQVLEYLINTNKIDQPTYYEVDKSITDKTMNFDGLVDFLKSKNFIKAISPLNVDVGGFIKELGAINAQEWAGFAQDLRNDKQGLEDMTAKPVKKFLSAGVILAIGIVAIMAVILVPGSIHLGGGAAPVKGEAPGNNLLGPLSSMMPHFIDILFTKHPGFVTWMVDKMPWLVKALVPNVF